MAINRKRGRGSSWTVAPAEEEVLSVKLYFTLFGTIRKKYFCLYCVFKSFI
jgi:hypothetical protein